MSFFSVSPLTLVLGFVALAMGLIGVAVSRFLSSRAKKGQKALMTPPGPRGYPILGASHIMHQYVKPFDGFSAMREEFGDIYKVQLGSRQCVVVSNPTYIKEVLVNKCHDFANRPDFLRFHAIFRGDRNLSIALCDWSDKQKVRREMAFPFMHPRVQTMDGNRMNNIITSEMQNLVGSIDLHGTGPYEIRVPLNVCCANIFYEYICSKRFQQDDASFLRVVHIYEAVFKELFQGYAIDFMPFLKHVQFAKLNGLREQAKTVSQLTASIMHEHEADIDHERPRDLIDIYMSYIKDNQGNPESTLTMEDVEVIVEDLIGGHSVLGNMWLWGMYLLADHPEVCRNIREEVNAVTGGIRAPTAEDRKSMPYTEATTLEILRIVSSPIIPHVSTVDTNICDYSVGKNTMVILNNYAVNMEPSLWNEPRKFEPSRFLNASGEVCKPAYFIPFGTGKRACLGDGLVKSTLFLGLATLLQHFDISLPAGDIKPDLYHIPTLVVPTHEIRVNFSRVDELKETVSLS